MCGLGNAIVAASRAASPEATKTNALSYRLFDRRINRRHWPMRRSLSRTRRKLMLNDCRRRTIALMRFWMAIRPPRCRCVCAAAISIAGWALLAGPFRSRIASASLGARNAGSAAIITPARALDGRS